jgi:hypothetical protein
MCCWAPCAPRSYPQAGGIAPCVLSCVCDAYALQVYRMPCGHTAEPLPQRAHTPFYLTSSTSCALHDEHVRSDMICFISASVKACSPRSAPAVGARRAGRSAARAAPRRAPALPLAAAASARRPCGAYGRRGRRRRSCSRSRCAGPRQGGARPRPRRRRRRGRGGGGRPRARAVGARARAGRRRRGRSPDPGAGAGRRGRVRGGRARHAPAARGAPPDLGLAGVGPGPACVS